MEKENSLPLYLQIKQRIVDRIQSGEFQPGEKLPTEKELTDGYNVSRATIRHALDELELEEIIRRTPGVGTVVRHKRIKPEMMRLTGFSNLMISRGMKPDAKILKMEVIETPQKVREHFGDQEAAKTWFIKRLLLANDAPIGIQDLYIPTKFTFSPDDLYGMTSFYDLMKKLHHITPLSGSETLTATNAKKAEAALLKVNEGDALLDIWRVTCDENEYVFEVVHLLYIADRYEYQVKLYP